MTLWSKNGNSATELLKDDGCDSGAPCGRRAAACSFRFCKIASACAIITSSSSACTLIMWAWSLHTGPQKQFSITATVVGPRGAAIQLHVLHVLSHWRKTMQALEETHLLLRPVQAEMQELFSFSFFLSIEWLPHNGIIVGQRLVSGPGYCQFICDGIVVLFQVFHSALGPREVPPVCNQDEAQI